MKKNKDIFIIVLIALIAALAVVIFIRQGLQLSTTELNNSKPEYNTDKNKIKAKVIDVIGEETKTDEYSGGQLETTNQVLSIKILNGEFRGKTVKAYHNLNAFFSKYSTYYIKKGDTVYIQINETEMGEIDTVHITELSREKYIWTIVSLFVILLLIIGGIKGIKACVSLLITCLVVFKIILPLIFKGYNAVLVSTIAGIAIIIITLVIINGFSSKTLAAGIGTTFGVFSAGVLAIITGNMARLSGLGSEESSMLMYLPQDITFDFRGILFAGIIIGSLGAVMDVGMSIASSLYELKENSTDISPKQIYKSGINIGRDIMGTMSNTLILAYTGGSISLMLLFLAYKVPFDQIINSDIIATEIVRAIAGSIGIIITIPFTAIVSAFLYNKVGYKLEEIN